MYTKGYISQAIHNPKADSRNAQTPKTAVSTYETVSNPKRLLTKIETLNTSPMRAAKTFGPALIKRSFKENRFTRLFERMVNTLYLELLVALNKKSTNKELMINKLPVNAKAIRNSTVNSPLRRATVSLIF